MDPCFPGSVSHPSMVRRNSAGPFAEPGVQQVTLRCGALPGIPIVPGRSLCRAGCPGSHPVVWSLPGNPRCPWQVPLQSRVSSGSPCGAEPSRGSPLSHQGTLLVPGVASLLGHLGLSAVSPGLRRMAPSRRSRRVHRCGARGAQRGCLGGTHPWIPAAAPRSAGGQRCASS